MLSRFLTNAVEILMLSGPGLLPKDPVGVVQGQERILLRGKCPLSTTICVFWGLKFFDICVGDVVDQRF